MVREVIFQQRGVNCLRGCQAARSFFFIWSAIFGQNDAERSGKCQTAREKLSYGDAVLAGGQRTDNQLSEGIWFTTKEGK